MLPSLTDTEAVGRILDQDKATPEVDARRWDGRTLGEPAEVTYGFVPSGALVDPNGDRTEQALSGAEITAVEGYVQLIMDVADITLTRVGTGYSTAGDIDIQKRTLNLGDATWQFFVGIGDDADELVAATVTLANTDNGSEVPWFSQRHFLHEILHALGLEHPGAYDGGPSRTSYDVDAEYLEDSTQYSVMSYFDGAETGASYGRPPTATLMLHDVMALQRLYGPNDTAYGGDTVYGWGSNTGRATWEVASDQDPIFGAIWDTGGFDTLDLSGETWAQVIDLREGAFSSVTGEVLNLSIAPGAVIEAAIGGRAGDQVRGNAAANVLHGGAGPDSLRGGAGDDLLEGQGGRDLLLANDGQDTLMGGGGADRLVSGPGQSILSGGVGKDRFVFTQATLDDRSDAGPDRILDFELGADRIGLASIDADPAMAGDQAFAFREGGAGAVRLANAPNGDTVVRIHVDSDGRADLVIRIQDGARLASSYGDADFIL